MTITNNKTAKINKTDLQKISDINSLQHFQVSVKSTANSTLTQGQPPSSELHVLHPYA